MAATVAGILLVGTHAARPAATSLPVGTLYSCTTDSLIYQTDGATWSTWATLGGGFGGFATPAVVLGTAAAAGVATTAIRSDSTLLAFDATNPAAMTPASAAVVGVATVAARRDHVHPFTDVGVINVVIDGGGVALTTGRKIDLYLPFALTINEVTMGADQSGSVVVDIWKDTHANYPPTVADTITAAAKPTITTATKSQDSTLTGWTTSCAAGVWLTFNVDSATTITRVTLALKYTRA